MSDDGNNTEDQLVFATEDPRLVSSESSMIQTEGTRCLVVCLDGSENERGEFCNIVIQLYKLLWKDKKKQPCYFQPFVGTTCRASPPSMKQRIIQAFEFLMDEYEKGDRICLFGYGDGAHLVRALAGMIHFVGLLEKIDKGSVDAAYDLYATNQVTLANMFKGVRARSVDIDFLGVWETTASSKTFPFIKSNPSVRTFRHVLALDERRSKFTPLYYEKHPKNESAREVWFSGSHDDVGGGSGSTKPSSNVNGQASLARITLRWMVGECFGSNTGIFFNKDRLQELFKDSTTEDRVAAERCPIQDQSAGIPYILQGFFLRAREPPLMIFPTEGTNATVMSESSLLSYGDKVPVGTVCCHKTVEMRKEKYRPSYVPQATLPDDLNFVQSNSSSLTNLLGLTEENVAGK